MQRFLSRHREGTPRSRLSGVRRSRGRGRRRARKMGAVSVPSARSEGQGADDCREAGMSRMSRPTERREQVVLPVQRTKTTTTQTKHERVQLRNGRATTSQQQRRTEFLLGLESQRRCDGAPSCTCVLCRMHAQVRARSRGTVWSERDLFARTLRRGEHVLSRAIVGDSAGGLCI